MTINSWTFDTSGDGLLDVNDGGTGISTYTTGDLIQGSGSAWAKLAIGSTDEVLTRSGGATAWAASTATTGWKYITSAAASSSASIDFDSAVITSGYKLYAVVFRNIRPSADGAFFRLQLSPDNGTTIRTSGYVGANFEMETTNSTSLTNIISMGRKNYGNGSDEGHGISIAIIANAADSGVKTAALTMQGTISAADSTGVGMGWGRYDTAESHNFLKFFMDSGNLETAEAVLYGLETPA